MSTYRAIAVIGEALVGILRENLPDPEFHGATIELYQSTNFRAPMDEGASIYLYRAVPSASRRNLPPRIGLDGRRFRPSIPWDLHYLVTPWGRSAGRQHRLLGWAVRTIEDYSPLGAGLLNHYAVEVDTFSQDESHDIMFDTISMQDMSSVWDLDKPAIQLSVSFVVRQVTLDSERSVPEGANVQIRNVVAGTSTAEGR